MRVEASEGREIIVANDAGCQRDLLDPDAWHGPARPSCSCGRALLSNLSGGEVDGESEINRGDVSPLHAGGGWWGRHLTASIAVVD